MTPFATRLALAALAAATLTTARAQDKVPARSAAKGYARVGVGLNVLRPLSVPGGNKVTAPWLGVHYRTNWLEMGYASGKYNASGEDALPAQTGAKYYMGGSFPIGAWGVGRRVVGTHGLLIMPIIGGGAAYTTMGDLKAWQAYVAPGVSLQLPYFLVDFKVMPTYTFGDDDAPNAALRGLTLQPQVTLQFDGLWEVFAPRKSYDGHASGVNTYTTRTLVSSNSYADTYRVTTTTSPYDFDMFVVGGESFWAVSPRVTGSFNNSTRANTLVGGLGMSLRASVLSADVFGEYGQYGINGGWTQKPTTDNLTPREGEVDKNETRYGGSRRGGRALLRAGLDLPALFQAMAFHSDGGGDGATKFFRLTGGGGVGYAYVGGPMTFTNPEQVAALDKYFNPTPVRQGSQTYTPAKPVQNEFSDPRLGGSGYCWQWYAQVEVGVASLSFEANRYRANPLGNSNTITLSYLFPYKLVKRARQNAGL